MGVGQEDGGESFVNGRRKGGRHVVTIFLSHLFFVILSYHKTHVYHEDTEPFPHFLCVAFYMLYPCLMPYIFHALSFRMPHVYLSYSLLLQHGRLLYKLVSSYEIR